MDAAVERLHLARIPSMLSRVLVSHLSFAKFGQRAGTIHYKALKDVIGRSLWLMVSFSRGPRSNLERPVDQHFTERGLVTAAHSGLRLSIHSTEYNK